MDLEVINKLFLELSQVATARTQKEVELFNMLRDANDILRSTMAICRRQGREVEWPAFTARVEKVLNEQHHIVYPPVDTQPAFRSKAL